MEVTLLQAALVGLACWLGSCENPQPFGLSFSDTLSRPIVGGAIVGLILGDVATGCIIGAAIQTVYISNIVAGGVSAADQAFVTYPCTALAMAAGADSALAITLATTVGVLGAAGFAAYETFMSVFYGAGDRALENGSITGMKRAYILGPAITSFAWRFGITFAVVFLGSTFAQDLLAAIPETVIHIMTVLGGVLPAVGISVLLTSALKEYKMLAFFILGVLLVSSGLSMVTVAAIAGCLAAIFIVFVEKAQEFAPATASATNFDEENDEEVEL